MVEAELLARNIQSITDQASGIEDVERRELVIKAGRALGGLVLSTAQHYRDLVSKVNGVPYINLTYGHWCFNKGVIIGPVDDPVYGRQGTEVAYAMVMDDLPPHYGFSINTTTKFAVQGEESPISYNQFRLGASLFRQTTNFEEFSWDAGLENAELEKSGWSGTWTDEDMADTLRTTAHQLLPTIVQAELFRKVVSSAICDESLNPEIAMRLQGG